MHSCACCCMTNNITRINNNQQQQQQQQQQQKQEEEQQTYLRLWRSAVAEAVAEALRLERRRTLGTTSTGGAWYASSSRSSYNNDLNGEPTESATCSAGTVAVTIARTTSSTSSSQRQTIARSGEEEEQDDDKEEVAAAATAPTAHIITKELQHLFTTPASLCKILLKQFTEQVSSLLTATKIASL
ncbi:CTD small phosphatase-like protein 2 isoform X3 [Drosophila navojoa]|uniref:CTD small phosphatase-like protein 2 isoform X2 n=1 Tax=Drosophila navojoa TaxID=7232 RepID=UPI0011BEB993|nr:CTD small phosphatase-like protein 2 isoform X2 [Drosophila navojoa]XP_030245729.1 CTD small phosphatase-like protein 2 isoform X3 [Drosophila navojoa]